MEGPPARGVGRQNNERRIIRAGGRCGARYRGRGSGWAPFSSLNRGDVLVTFPEPGRVPALLALLFRCNEVVILMRDRSPHVGKPLRLHEALYPFPRH